MNPKVEHIVDAYNASTPAERRAGAAWYPSAYALAQSMDPENPSRAAGVIAALSPQQRWSVNIAQAARMIGWADALSEDDRVHQLVGTAPKVHFLTQRIKAIAIAAYGVNPLEVLHGPKESAFYGAIMGHTDAVVVDRWTARVAEPGLRHGTQDERVTVAQYRRIAQAYREAAKRLGRPVRDVQATVWIHIRGAGD